VIAESDGPPITVLAGSARYLQRTVGNVAFGQLLVRRVSSPQVPLQRQSVPATDVDTRYRDAVDHGQWSTVAQILDGLSDGEITSRVRALTPAQATALRAVVQSGPDRVRAAVLDLLFDLAVAGGRWAEVVEHLNGFNDPDIVTHLGRLSHDQLIFLYTAALGSMSERILTPIETADRDAAFQACVRTATWARGATVLDGFPDPDLTAHVTALTAAQRASMLAACPASARRARVALIGRPTSRYVVPFDRNPQSAPGERIIFRAEYDHAMPALLFQLVFTGTGGAFDAAGGPVTKTVAGLESGNTYFVIDTGMTAATPATMRLEVQLLDGTVMVTENWTFGVKTTVPTTITQIEAETDTPLPGVYHYQLGPDIGAPGHPDYQHQTILERFGPRTGNIHLADLKPAFASAHGLTNDADITAHFFGASGLNGTFTIDANDRIGDQHGGGMPDKAVFVAALVTMKEITNEIRQTYEVQPGVALGSYIIRRTLRLDGSKWVRKSRVP
jgi:hypothetical protein